MRGTELSDTPAAAKSTAADPADSALLALIRAHCAGPARGLLAIIAAPRDATLHEEVRRALAVLALPSAKGRIDRVRGGCGDDH